jgi:hypothetical protein
VKHRCSKLISIFGVLSNRQRCYCKGLRKGRVLWWHTSWRRYRWRGSDDRLSMRLWQIWRRCWFIWLNIRSWWSTRRWMQRWAQGFIAFRKAKIKMICIPSFHFRLNYLQASLKLMSPTYLWCLVISPISKMKVDRLKCKTKSTTVFSRSSLIN